MPAYRIVYTRGEAQRPETLKASFNDLDQALDVFAARGLRILYIAEDGNAPGPAGARVPAGPRVKVARDEPEQPTGRNAFPLRRFSSRVMA